MLRKTEPKLVKVLKNKVENIQDIENVENRCQIISEVLQILSQKLVTFGPILKSIHDEYSKCIKDYKKDILIEQKRREL